MEEINKAADIAQATEFIKNKPDGINSVVSQGGHSLSGRTEAESCDRKGSYKACGNTYI